MSKPSTKPRGKSKYDLQTTQEVVFPDGLSPGISGTPCDFGTLLDTLGRRRKQVLGHSVVAVVRSRCDVRGVMVDGNLGRQGGGTGGHLLLVTLALFLVQS